MASILERNKKIKVPTKTREEHQEDALYREVWEDVNNEKTVAFVKKYYRYLIAGALAVLIIITSVQLIRHQANASRQATALNYETAIETMDERALAALGKKSSGATADLALFQSWILQDDVSKLEELAKNGNTRDFRDLATIHLATIKGDAMDAAEFEKFLSPLNTKKSPYYFNAALLIAQKYLATGDSANANIWLDKIIADRDAPTTIAGTAATLK